MENLTVRRGSNCSICLRAQTALHFILLTLGRGIQKRPSHLFPFVDPSHHSPSPQPTRSMVYKGQQGKPKRGGGGGYHFASSAGLPKLDSTLEILFVTACASQSAQTAQSEGDLLLVCRQKGTSPSSAGRRGGGSLVCYPTLGVRQTRQSDSHFCLILGHPWFLRQIARFQPKSLNVREVKICMPG